MTVAESRPRVLALAMVAMLAVVGLSEPETAAASSRRSLPPLRASCGQAAEASGLDKYLKKVVSDTSPRGARARANWQLPAASPTVVERLLVDSICTAAIAGYNTHLDSTSPPLTRAFVYRVDTLYVVEPIWAPGAKHFKLIMVLNQLWQHVASIAA